MEELGDIKKARNNLLFISILNVLVLFFSQEIKEINILGLIKLTDINSWKVLIILLIANLYFFRRYHQLYDIFDKKYNYTILFKDILEKSKKNIIKIYDSDNKDIKELNILRNGNIIIKNEKSNFNNIFNNEAINTSYFINNNGTETIILNNNKYYDNIIIKYKLNYKIKLLKFNFYLKEKKFLDYIFPIWLGNISLILLTIKLIYEVYFKI